MPMVSAPTKKEQKIWSTMAAWMLLHPGPTDKREGWQESPTNLSLHPCSSARVLPGYTSISHFDLLFNIYNSPLFHLYQLKSHIFILQNLEQLTPLVKKHMTPLRCWEAQTRGWWNSWKPPHHCDLPLRPVLNPRWICWLFFVVEIS